MINEKKPFSEQVGDYLIDISKLTFGGVVLSAILEVSKDKTIILLYGIVSTLLMAVSGLIISNIKNKRQ